MSINNGFKVHWRPHWLLRQAIEFQLQEVLEAVAESLEENIFAFVPEAPNSSPGIWPTCTEWGVPQIHRRRGVLRRNDTGC